MRRSGDIHRGGGCVRVRRAALALACSAAGCDGVLDGYEAGLRYPRRTDPVVVSPPASTPIGPTPAGKLDEQVAKLADLGGVVADPGRLPPELAAELTAALDARFGTPANPLLPDPPTPGWTPDVLAAGSRLYRRQCAQCHGLAGDGRGPTGPWLSPLPRDFRSGVFKSSAGGSGKPTAADLVRVLRRGVPGTSMPAFDLLPDAEVEAVAGYVAHLSQRGEVELRAVRALLDSPDDVPAAVDEAARKVAAAWRAAGDVDPVSPAAGGDVRRGFELFVGAAGCASCHADFGRHEQYRFDAWGAAARVPDLTRGPLRWGDQPADLARTIRHGVAGSAMPSYPNLSAEQVQDLVALVKSLPYPPQLPEDVRGVVYPQAIPTNDE